jgi:deazaflavin-dependent oxidoreductase (nitroreductase family)
MARPLLRLLGTSRSGDLDAPPGAARRAKRRVSRMITTRAVNPIVRPLVERGPLASGWALLETRGRTTGKPRVVPVGNGLRGDTFWIVTEHGHHADYVKNIKANPRVRVKAGGRWRTGTAHITGEDPYTRMRSLRRPLNDAVLLAVGTEQLVIRVDLDPS